MAAANTCREFDCITRYISRGDASGGGVAGADRACKSSVTPYLVGMH